MYPSSGYLNGLTPSRTQIAAPRALLDYDRLRLVQSWLMVLLLLWINSQISLMLFQD